MGVDFANIRAHRQSRSSYNVCADSLLQPLTASMICPLLPPA